ncbi:MAG: Hpt domain-containing protein [Hyphomicrobiales bacterium]|nr:Hpt domain-containing protein [Hyphomicrobiales bacterium]MBV9974837.1 Hpt domain-containing protein [Hyphomicrobiales bacterium]
MKPAKNRQNPAFPEGWSPPAAETKSWALLDSSYLDSQVYGDPQLAEELLRLYAESLAELAPAVCGKSGQTRREAAHKLKGASLAVGAFALARLCEHVETEILETEILETEIPSRPSGIASDDAAPQAPPLSREVALALEATKKKVMELLGPGCA